MQLSQKEQLKKKLFVARLYVLYHLITDPRNLKDEYLLDEQGDFVYEVDKTTGKTHRKATGYTYLTCSCEQMRIYVSNYGPYVDYLRQVLKLISRPVQGGLSEGMSHYLKRKEWDIDVSDPQIDQFIAEIKENPTKIWNKTNEPSGFSINANMRVEDVLIRKEFESEKHFEERIAGC